MGCSQITVLNDMDDACLSTRPLRMASLSNLCAHPSGHFYSSNLLYLALPYHKDQCLWNYDNDFKIVS